MAPDWPIRRRRLYRSASHTGGYSASAPHVPVHRHTSGSGAHEQRLRIAALPPVPSCSFREVEALGMYRAGRRIVRDVLEHDVVANAHISPGVNPRLEPGALMIGKRAAASRVDRAAGSKPGELVGGRIQAPLAARTNRQTPWHPPPVAEMVGLAGVAVDRVVGGVIDI